MRFHQAANPGQICNFEFERALLAAADSFEKNTKAFAIFGDEHVVDALSYDGFERTGADHLQTRGIDMDEGCVEFERGIDNRPETSLALLQAFLKSLAPLQSLLDVEVRVRSRINGRKEVQLPIAQLIDGVQQIPADGRLNHIAARTNFESLLSFPVNRAG